MAGRTPQAEAHATQLLLLEHHRAGECLTLGVGSFVLESEYFSSAGNHRHIRRNNFAVSF
jgi:hypothetical protein